MWNNRRGQVTVEMAVLFTFVIAALIFMGAYLQRGAQGMMKSNSDSLGQQFSAKGNWSSFSSQSSKSNSLSGKTASSQCSEYAAKIGNGTYSPAANCTPNAVAMP